MDKRLEILEKELEDLRSSHRSLWDMYGSELCAGDMSGQERALEEKIKKLKEELNPPQKCEHCGEPISLEFPSASKNSKGEDDGWRHIDGDHYYRHCKEVTLDYKECINFNSRKNIWFKW